MDATTLQIVSLVFNGISSLGLVGVLKWAIRVHERLTAIEQWARTQHGADFG